MKVFLAFVQKEFRHVFRDTRSIIILIGLPLVMILLFGFALSNEVKNSKIAIIDNSKDELSRKIIERLNASRYFTVEKVLQSENEIESSFRKGESRLVIIFPSNFQSDLYHQNSASVRIVADASDPNTANITVNYASAIIGAVQKDINGTLELPYRIKTESEMIYNPQLKSTFNFVPGVMTLILMLLGAMMTSVSIVKEKETGTMEILLVSPMQPNMVIISKAIPYMFLCFIDVIIILIMAYTVLEMPIRGNLFLLLAESLLFIITTLSLGLLVSNIVNQQQVAMFISLVGFLLPSLIFSGFMFPLENMPKPLQIISNVVPTKWFYFIVKTIMVKGLGFSYVIKETGILILMTLFFLTIAIRRFKIRLE